MIKPIILVIDDDPQVLMSIRRDLRRNYQEKYQIVSTDSPSEALTLVQELKKKGESIALLLSDQRMPEMLGVEFLSQAMKIYPEAKRVLLTAYSDIEAAIKAINEVRLDYYLNKPWDPPEEKLYPVIDDLLFDWEKTYTPEFRGIRILGYQYSPKSHVIKDFLSSNLISYQWLDMETEARAAEIMAENKMTVKDLPLLVFEDGTVVSNPSVGELAPRIGLHTQARRELYDVAIIGAGPSGLAAAVYGASEGLKTLLIERKAPGGQAGTSSRIENYLGFPSGLRGADLTHRAITQALRFGAEFLSPQEVVGLSIDGIYKQLTLSDQTIIHSKSLIIATGVDYRKMPAKGAENFTGAGIYYGAATTEANTCKDKQVYIIGGGNSAGQGAVYLSKFASMVYILVRKADLSSSMSSYLIEQIQSIPNIQVIGNREVLETLGSEKLECLVIQNLEDNSRYTVQADAMFVFIGAKPFTDWIPSNVLRDDKGFIITGKDLVSQPDYPNLWKRKREPYMLETCQTGIFAAGDVRAGAMNRVASAVGEGSMAIKFVHEYLAEN